MKSQHTKLIGLLIVNCLIVGCVNYQTTSLGKLMDPTVQIIRKETLWGITFYAKLINCSEATITFDATCSDMILSHPLPITIDSKGLNYFKIVRLGKIGDSWKYNYNFVCLHGRSCTNDSSNFNYSLPYKDGPFKVIQGYKGSFSHKEGSNDEYAIDWKMPIGTEIYSARPGVIVGYRMDSDTAGTDTVFTTCSNYVIIMHDDGTFANYVHLKHNGVLVKLGQIVKENELLALSGNTGHSDAPHLHFSIFCNIDGLHRKTIPVKFKVGTGKIAELKQGDVY
jgi:hypothetical protein